MAMAAAGGCFGEYECLLAPRDVRTAISFARELFTREFVVRRASSELCARSKTHARLHRGHVVVSVDGVAVRSLSSCQFDAIWQSLGADSGLDVEDTDTVWRVRFRDRRRAELAVDMHKDRSQFVRVRPLVPGASVSGQDELEAELSQVSELIWRFELGSAHSRVQALPCASDPLAHVLALELEVVRALASHDALEIKKARAAASQAVAWLDRLVGLLSLSFSCRLLAMTALAETLLMRVLVDTLACALSSSALLSVAGKVAVLATSARRSATLYCELQRLLRDGLEPKSSSKLNGAIRKELEARVRFGLAVLRLCGSLTRSSSPLEWFSSALLPALDGREGHEGPGIAVQASLSDLFTCVQTADTAGGPSSRCRRWAELLLLLVGPSAIDVTSIGASPTCSSRQEGYHDRKAKFTVVAEHRRSLQLLRKRVCSRASPPPMLLWAAGDFERAVNCLTGDERGHVLRFDAGRVHLERHEFEKAARQFVGLSKCPSAPDRLRGFSCVFLAVAYLGTASVELLRGDSGQEAGSKALLRSVRALLRCADRCLADGGESIEDPSCTVRNPWLDPEVMSLRRRLRHYVKGDDSSLLLLPIEVLYVFCYRFNGLSRREVDTSSGSQQLATASSLWNEQHARMLQYLDTIAWRFNPSSRDDTGPLPGVCRRAEWMLLRAIVLFNSGDFSADARGGASASTSVHSQLEDLRALLTALDRPSAELQRSFVVPVALFYGLQLRLLHRPGKLNGDSKLTASEGVDWDSDDVLWRWWLADGDGRPNEHAYALQYDGKVRALRRLVAARASSSLGSCDSTDSEDSTP